MFEVIVLGVGDAFSTRHHGSSFLLSEAGFLLAVDCPADYRKALQAASAASGRKLDVADIGHMLITHIHGDHMAGLEGLALYKYNFEKKRLRLALTPEVRSVIWDQRLAAGIGLRWDGGKPCALGFEDFFEHLPLDWDKENAIGPFRVRLRRTRHMVPASALLVRAGGRCFGYSCDTVFDPELIRFLEPADLIFHEVGTGGPHTSYAELAGLPEALRRKMRLIHYPDGFAPADGALALLQEGETLAV